MIFLRVCLLNEAQGNKNCTKTNRLSVVKQEYGTLWGIRPKEVNAVVLHFLMLMNLTKFKLARNSLNKLNMTRNVQKRTKGYYRKL